MNYEFCSDKSTFVPTSFRHFEDVSERRNASARKVFGFCSDNSDIFTQISPLGNKKTGLNALSVRRFFRSSRARKNTFVVGMSEQRRIVLEPLRFSRSDICRNTVGTVGTGKECKVIREIEGTGGKYFVSDDGNALNRDGRLLSPCLSGNYYMVNIKQHGIARPVLIHRLVAAAFCKRTIGQDEVHHKDGNTFNNVSSNLEWVTRDQHWKVQMGHNYTAIKSTNIHTGKVTLYPTLYSLKHYGIRKVSVVRSIERQYVYLSCAWNYFYEPLDMYGHPVPQEATQ